MSFFTTDHGEAKNRFEPIKPGKYEVVVTAAEVTNAKSSGAEMIKVTYTVRTDVDQEFQKRKIFDNFVASEKAMFKFQQAAKAMAFGQGQAIPSIQWFADQLMFKAFKLTIRNVKDNYQGEDRIKEEVSFIDAPSVPYSGGEGGKPDPFAMPEGASFPDDFPSDNGDDIDETPPWEKAEAAPAEEKKTRGGRKPKAADPFADDGKPIEISDDDLPF